MQIKADLPTLRAALKGARSEIEKALAALDEVESKGKKPKPSKKAGKKKHLPE